VIEQDGQFQILGLVGKAEEVGSQVLGYSVIASDDDLAKLVADAPFALVAAGQIKSAKARVRLFSQAVTYGYQMPTIVSPRAAVSRHAKIGAGTIIMHGAIVNAGATIGENCIINSVSVIEHDSFIGDHVHISTGVIINGAARVGRESFVGSGSVIKEGINVGSSCIVAMGSVVRRNIADETTFIPGRQ
jgi:sugar O-acyltransferase (sialic acid O-acetyltransferase NeuD family)